MFLSVGGSYSVFSGSINYSPEIGQVSYTVPTYRWAGPLLSQQRLQNICPTLNCSLLIRHSDTYRSRSVIQFMLTEYSAGSRATCPIDLLACSASR